MGTPAEPARQPAQTTAATLTTSTTGVITWSVDRWLFKGQIPPEVYVWLQIAVPTLLGLVAAEVAHRRACKSASQQ